MPVGEEVHHRVLIRLRLDQACRQDVPDLGGEHDTALERGVVEVMYATDGVNDEVDARRRRIAGVNDGGGEQAVEFHEALGPGGLVGAQDDRAVVAGRGTAAIRRAMPAACMSAKQFAGDRRAQVLTGGDARGSGPVVRAHRDHPAGPALPLPRCIPKEGSGPLRGCLPRPFAVQMYQTEHGSHGCYVLHGA